MMTRKKSTIFLCVSLVAIIGFFALSGPSQWSTLDEASIPKGMNAEQVGSILKNEGLSYKVGDNGNIEVPQSAVSKTQLMLTGLRALQSLHQEQPSNGIIGELVVQQYLKKKIDELMNATVGKGAYISEVYVSPTHSSLSINKRIKPNDLVTYFLNSPGVKRIYFRLVVDSDVTHRKELDQEYIESRVKRHLRSLLHDLKGVRLTEEITFLPFYGTGLGAIAANETTTSSEELWVSRLLIPMLVASAIIITLLLALLFKKHRQQTILHKKEPTTHFEDDFERISFEEDENFDEYVQLKDLPHGVVESFTNCADIGNLLMFLHPKEAAKYLQMLPFDQQVKSIGECIGYQHLDGGEFVRVIEKRSRQLEIIPNLESILQRGVVKHIAKILKEFQPANSKRILQELHQIDANSLIKLKNEFFVMTSLTPLGGEGLQYIINKGHGLDLLLAVHDSDSSIKENVIQLAPKEIRDKLEGDLSKVDPSKVQAAQLRVAQLIAEFERKQNQTKHNYQTAT